HRRHRRPRRRRLHHLRRALGRRVQGVGLPDLAVRAGERPARARRRRRGGRRAVTRPDPPGGAQGLRRPGGRVVAVRGDRRLHFRVLPGAPRSVQTRATARVRAAAQDDFRQDPARRAARRGRRRFDRRIPGGGLPMMSSYASAVAETALLGDTIGANLDATVARFGDREVLVGCPSGRRWTYAAFGAEVDELARAFLATGVRKGDRVGIWSPNCPEWVLVQYATAKIGAIMVNINPAYRKHELEYVLNQSGVRALVSATQYKTSDYRGMVEEVRG